MAGAIQSVNGAKVIVAPKPATASNPQTIAVVELGGKASLGAVTVAIEGANTPHKGQSPPAVATAIAGKLKPGATPEAIREALQKANLVE